MRLLVIVSGDYGEIGAAMYFLRGLHSAHAPVVLLPEARAQSISAMPGLELRTYERMADISRALDDSRCDTVLLSSGYLLTITTGLSLPNVVGLIRTLQRRRVTLLTSDPFLGLLPSPASLPFRELRRRDGRSAFIGSCVLYPVRRLLRDAWHIYPAPIERLPAKPGTRRLSYFNAAAQEAFSAHQGDPAGRPTWLFILSKADCTMLMKAQGDRFVSRLVERLEDGVALGREVLMIGPEILVVAVRERLGNRPGIGIRSEAPYASYMQDLMRAEYAFYWNYFSFSIMHRVLANLPVFFFDEGHLPHILPAVGEAGVRMFYDGWRPPVLPLGGRLDEEDLERRAREATHEFRRIAEGMRRSPSPDELLRRVGGNP
jgi:hypothetical protein